MKIKTAKSLVAMCLAIMTICFLSACGDSEKERELAKVDKAIATNNYEIQRFNSDAANVGRFAEGFAKGYEGNLSGIARDAAATYIAAEQLNENNRQLRAYRQQLAGKSSSGGFLKWLVIIGVIAFLIRVFASQAKKT